MHDARITGKQASPNGLRHGFAAWAVLRGVPVTTAQKWMGHVTLETTMIYASLCGHEETRIAERMWLRHEQLVDDALVVAVVAKLVAGISQGDIFCSGRLRYCERRFFRYVYDLGPSVLKNLDAFDLSRSSFTPTGHWWHRFRIASTTSALDILATENGLSYVPAGNILRAGNTSLDITVGSCRVIPDQLF